MAAGSLSDEGQVKTTGKVSVEITNEGADGYVIIDSVRLLDKKGD